MPVRQVYERPPRVAARTAIGGKLRRQSRHVVGGVDVVPSGKDRKVDTRLRNSIERVLEHVTVAEHYAPKKLGNEIIQAKKIVATVLGRSDHD